MKANGQDYDDPNEDVIEADDKEKCYENCFNKSSCLAYTFSLENKTCELKFNLSKPIPCTSEEFCGKIPGKTYSNNERF